VCDEEEGQRECDEEEEGRRMYVMKKKGE
jgi:hypothetical protein